MTGKPPAAPELADLIRLHEALQVEEARLRAQLDDRAARVDLLVAQGHRFRSAFEEGEVPRLVTDAAGVIRESNGAASAFLGLGPAFLLGKPLVVFVDRDDMPGFWSALQDVQRRPVLLQLGMHGRGLPSRRVELSGSSLADPAQRLWQVRFVHATE